MHPDVLKLIFYSANASLLKMKIQLKHSLQLFRRLVKLVFNAVADGNLSTSYIQFRDVCELLVNLL